MICPDNANKSFDDLDCRDCKWYYQCMKMEQDGNIFGEGDNSIAPKKEVEKNQDKSPTNTERIIINAMAQEIKDKGEDYVFNNINAMEMNNRLGWVEFFFSAKRLLEKGEY